MRRTLMMLSGLLVLALILAGCSTSAPTPTPTPTTTAPGTGMANPAAVYCTQQANTRYEIRTNPDGSQYGVCILPDGTVCDEWAYYRGTCPPAPTTTAAPVGMANPAAVYCTQQANNRYEIRTNASTGGQYGVCILPGGTVCDEWAYYRGTCPATTGMANPSATFCVSKNYTYQIVTNPDGSQSGNCVFPSGKSCDGWAYYRGECNETTAK